MASIQSKKEGLVLGLLTGGAAASLSFITKSLIIAAGGLPIVGGLAASAVALGTLACVTKHFNVFESFNLFSNLRKAPAVTMLLTAALSGVTIESGLNHYASNSFNAAATTCPVAPANTQAQVPALQNCLQK